MAECSTAQRIREFSTVTHPERQSSGRMGRALVFRSYQKLEAADSVGDIITILADVVRAHHWTWERYGVLHRNISTSSIMWYRDGGQVRGVLCDFDPDASAAADEPHHNADVRPFMAMDLLRREEGGKAVPHLYRHELESFFYVFAYVCAVWDPDEKKFGHLYRWEQGSLADIAAQKVRFLVEPARYDRTFRKAHPALAALVDFQSSYLPLLYMHYRVIELYHQLYISIRSMHQSDVDAQKFIVENGMSELLYTKPEMTYEGFMCALDALCDV